MDKDYSDIDTKTSKKKKVICTGFSEEFKRRLEPYQQKSPPVFDETIETLAAIENVEEKITYLQSIIKRYTTFLKYIRVKNSTYLKEHSGTPYQEISFNSEEFFQTKETIRVRNDELGYFQTKLEHYNLNLASSKNKTNLKILHDPFTKEDAAIYCGCFSVSTIEKHPDRFGADKSNKTYRYSKEKLDEEILKAGKTSLYWDYPNLVIRKSVKHIKFDYGLNEPSKIIWNEPNPDRKMKRLIEIWTDGPDPYISLFEVSIDDYCDKRFGYHKKDQGALGDFINIKIENSKLLWWIIQLHTQGVISLDSKKDKEGERNYKYAKFICTHFKKIVDNKIIDFNIGSLSKTRSDIREYEDLSLNELKEHPIYWEIYEFVEKISNL